MTQEDKEIFKLFKSIKDLSTDENFIKNLTDGIKLVMESKQTYIRNANEDKEKLDEFFKYASQIIIAVYQEYKERKGTEAKSITEEIEYLGRGHTSITFKVGDNVIKFSKTTIDKRNISKIKNEEFIIPIYFEKAFNVGEKIFYGIEIAPMVDTKDISIEDTYSVYKQLRQLGYIWNDPDPKNVGRIIESNGCKIPEHDETLTIGRPKGNLVIIDLEDFSYVGEITPEYVMDEITYFAYNQTTYTFETRYQKEKKNAQQND